MPPFGFNSKKTFRYPWLIFSLILLGIVVGAGWFATGYLGDRARQEIIKDNESAIALLSAHLTSEMNKIEGAVRSLSGSPWIAPALISRTDIDIAHANSALDRYNAAIDASVSYLMDGSGITIASSNRNARDSFVGKSYRFPSLLHTGDEREPWSIFCPRYGLLEERLLCKLSCQGQQRHNSRRCHNEKGPR